MGNPHEFREVMMAVFGYTDRSPEEVLAEQKAKHDREMEEHRAEVKAGSKRKGAVTSGPVTGGKPSPVEQAKFDALMARAVNRVQSTEVTAE